MQLYSLTLQRATAITVSCHGNFSGQKQQEIAVGKGKNLEILKPDPNTGKVHTIYATDVFGVIRSLMSFRLTGGSKDYIIVGSDSGRICILEFNPVKNVLEKVHMETFGKSGCRRIVPGQYLAVDPKGRAVMIGAIEKQKLVYILNRDTNARLTISSPLEAHKSNTLVYHMVGVDVGFENPMFACIELDYEDADSESSADSKKMHQSLTFYELDLGLNHVVRKYSEELDEPSNFLIAVPGGSDGPSGVLVCSENFITYKNFGDQPDIRCPIPRRRNDLDDPDRGMLFVCSTHHKTKSMFFFLAQTEQGDIFKITMACDDDMVTEIKLKYFDTLAVAQTMHVLKSGFLFISSEFGNHALYQIAHLGDNPDEPEFTSSIQLDEGDTFFFVPRELKNLVLVDELDSLSPIMCAQVADLTNEDTPQLYAACGRSAKSSLRVLRHGLEVTEMAVSELPGNPNAVWTVKRRSDDDFDAYIVVSFINATLVLSIGETVEEITDSGFLGTTPTIACHQIGDDALVQIYPEGIRHIRADKRVNEWRAPGKKQITKCAVNQRQVVIALTGGELVYFEMDTAGHLNECTERMPLNQDVLCMALGSVPAGEQRTRFLAVGCPDNSVRMFFLDPKNCLAPGAMQLTSCPPESLAILDMSGYEGAGATSMYLNMGLQNGMLLRSVLDPATGDLTDTRTRFLGSKSVKLFKVKMQGNDAILGMSTRCWLSYLFQNRFHLTPLSYDSLEFASGFCSEQCPEGIVAIAGNTLRILALEKLGAVFNQVSAPLEFTPRRFVIEPKSQRLIIIETDHNSYTEVIKEKRKQQVAEEMIEAAGEEEQEVAAEMAAAFLAEDLPENIFGSPRAGQRYWASQIRILNPMDLTTVFKLTLDQNEAAVSCALVPFDKSPTPVLLVGIAKDMQLSPRECKTAFVNAYKINSDCSSLELLHTTFMDDIPQAMCTFHNKVLLGVGKCLRVYDLGKKKLLRKTENKHIPNLIVTINVLGDRIVVGDLQESFFFVRYRRQENQLVIFADDFTPRWTSAACMIDYRTVAGADKFGNIYIMRLPNDISDEVDEDPTGVRSLWDRGWLGGSAQKTEVINCTHIGEIVVSIQKTALIPGGPEAIVYSTIAGGVGALMPFSSKEDHEFFQHLEMYMRTEHPPICGRDHLSYKSSYYPVKNVIDGDLCEQFNSLDVAKQKQIAVDLDRQPHEVAKKLEDIRTRYAF